MQSSLDNPLDPHSEPLTLFMRRLSSRDILKEEEKRVLETAPLRLRDVSRGVDIVSEGDRPSESCLLLSGVSARYNMLPSGRRQITAFHFPGDFVDLHSFVLHRMDHGVMAVTECGVAYVAHSFLKEITDHHPRLGRILWRDTLIDAAVHRQWLVAAGRRSAASQMAHFFCETYLRLQAVGLAAGQIFTFPITQEDLGDALGLSVVHTNRTLKDLRETGLLIWKQREITILNWDGLCQAATFDPTYLDLPAAAQ
jgi:CRP-like cAMP-binding protein